METKSCVICGREVTRDESVAAYMEFSDVDSYVSYAADVDMNNVALWWMETHIPPRNEYADIYPMHIDCTQVDHVLDANNKALHVGDSVLLLWRTGDSNIGTIAEIHNAAFISIAFPDANNDVLDYELHGDSWYEINESQDPITITKAGAFLTPNWDALCEAISDAILLAPDSAIMRVKAELELASEYFDTLDEQDPSLKAMLYSMLNKLGYARIPFDALLPHENRWDKLA